MYFLTLKYPSEEHQLQFTQSQLPQVPQDIANNTNSVMHGATCEIKLY